MSPTAAAPEPPPTVRAYLDALEPDRRELLVAVRDVVAPAVPPGYVEAVAFRMITWSVPLERYPDTYNGRPLGYVALAAQKRHGSLHLMALDADSEQDRAFRGRWAAGGRRLDMGRACLRFRSLDDLDLPLLAETVAATGVDEYLALYEAARGCTATSGGSPPRGRAGATALRRPRGAAAGGSGRRGWPDGPPRP